jgi:hypothetical protein
MTIVNFSSYKCSSISFWSSQSFKNVHIINYRFEIRYLTHGYGYILIFEESVCEIKFTEEAEVS